MEDFLLKRISAVSDEEKEILTGNALDKRLYTKESDFIVDTEKLMHGRDISIRTHTSSKSVRVFRWQTVKTLLS